MHINWSVSDSALRLRPPAQVPAPRKAKELRAVLSPLDLVSAVTVSRAVGWGTRRGGHHTDCAEPCGAPPSQSLLAGILAGASLHPCGRP